MHNVLRKLLGATFLVAGWLCLSLYLNSPSIPSPFRVFPHLFSQQYEVLFKHIGVSLLRISYAMIIALIIGVAVGTVMATNKIIDGLLSPLIYFLMPIPKVALLPVFMLMMGLGEGPKILLISSVIVFQFIVASKESIDNIEKARIDTLRSLDIKGFSYFRHLLLPSLVPGIFSSLRLSFGISFSVLFFAETFSTKFGIGYFIMNSWAMANYLNMYAGIVLLSLVGIVIYELLTLCESYFLRWQVEQ